MNRHRQLTAGGSTPRLVYIIGSARSGSTLLDTILGANPDVESVGELACAVRYGWLGGGYCACGQLVERCTFWCRVRELWSERIGGDRLEAYEALLRRVELSRLWWMRLGRGDGGQGAWLVRYGRWTRALLEAIRQTSGKSVVVDSSKLRSRGLALAAVGGIDLRLIHLVRDVRGVVWSIKKRLSPNRRAGLPRGLRPRPAWRTALGWVAANLQAELVCRAAGPDRWLRVRYEDLVSDPAGVLDRIGRFIGADLEPVRTAVLAGRWVPVGHTVAGNRMRMAGRVRLQADWEWQERLSAADRRICGLAAGWLMQRYGYRPDVVRGDGLGERDLREAAA